jgi:hypothetical protein
LNALINLTGAGGFGSDYAFIQNTGDAPYVQWAGMRRIQQAVVAANPLIQVDNRQQNHDWGPWFWAVTGSYAEPIQSDEQPESWAAFTPDLHTARLTANKMRQENFDYRYNKLCPPERAPGFYSHQSDMLNSSGARAWDSNRFARDFDIFGHRYALLSSVGSAGLNTVVNTLPARDKEEHDAFPQAELDFITQWLRWTDDHRLLLARQHPLPVAPGHAKVNAFGLLYFRFISAHTRVTCVTSRTSQTRVPHTRSSASQVHIRVVLHAHVRHTLTFPVLARICMFLAHVHVRHKALCLCPLNLRHTLMILTRHRVLPSCVPGHTAIRLSHTIVRLLLPSHGP